MDYNNYFNFVNNKSKHKVSLLTFLLPAEGIQELVRYKVDNKRPAVNLKHKLAGTRQRQGENDK